jgi:hypothetical protein
MSTQKDKEKKHTWKVDDRTNKEIDPSINDEIAELMERFECQIDALYAEGIVLLHRDPEAPWVFETNKPFTKKGIVITTRAMKELKEIERLGLIIICNWNDTGHQIITKYIYKTEKNGVPVIFGDLLGFEGY